MTDKNGIEILPGDYVRLNADGSAWSGAMGKVIGALADGAINCEFQKYAIHAGGCPYSSGAARWGIEAGRLAFARRPVPTTAYTPPARSTSH